MGAGLMADEAAKTLTILRVEGPNDSSIEGTLYDADLSELESFTLDVNIGDRRVYWPQAIMKVGDLHLVGSMAVKQGEFNADEGDVWLHVYDQDWAHQESVQIAQHEPINLAKRVAFKQPLQLAQHGRLRQRRP